MVYAYDRNIQMPTKDLYNTQMMAMAINAAKDQYDDAQKRMDDLNKMYSDFYSPSDKDMENWQKYVVDPIKSQIDDLYARGIDPIRSAEGQAILAKASRNLPYGLMNKLKQSAKVGEKYVENASKLLSQNLYDPQYEKFLGRDLKNWDSLDPRNGIWQWSSPSEAPALGEYTSPMYEKRTARPLTKEEVVGFGSPYDPRQDYTGYLESDLLNNAVENLPAFLNTPYGRYQQYLAKQQLEDAAVENGIDPKSITEGQINRQLAENIAGANTRWLIAPKGEANEFVLDDYKTQNDIRAHQQKAAIDNRYDEIKFYREHPEYNPNSEFYIGTENDGGQGEKQKINLNNHNAMLMATGNANLFGGTSPTDYSTHWKEWGDKMSTIESDIVQELAKKHKGTYNVTQWVNRHSTKYAAGNFIDYMKNSNAKVSKNGNAVILNDSQTNDLYTATELMKRNSSKKVRSYGDRVGGNEQQKSTVSGNNLRNSIKNRINSGGYPYMYSNGRVVSQVESDNRLHYYFEVVVKRKNVDSNKENNSLNTDIMYFDTGIRSAKNGTSPEAMDAQKTTYQNFQGTNPISASRAATAESVGGVQK